jgi:dihydroorotate dehydrogenase (fumarate)/dihydroorotate dehydrogenase
MLYQKILRPVLFRFDAEWVHDHAIWASELAGSIAPIRALTDRFCRFSDERLVTEVAGIRFSNPVGLAAGYDKSGRAIAMMAAMGFGFVEIGSVSAFPSAGNPKPRLWRFVSDRAICVHYGLPNDGAEVVASRLAGKSWTVPLGINIVKTNRGIQAPADCAETIFDDYVRSITLLMNSATYLSLNLSCPNTEMGRDFFSDPGSVTELLTRLSGLAIPCPVFLKISPVGGVPAIERLLEAVDPFRFIAGFMFNLPPAKPPGLRTPRSVWESIPGAVAGEPAREPLDECLRQLYLRMDRKRYRLMAAGGVFSAEDAYRKICLGASLVQLMTGLIYEGPTLVATINRGLCRLLQRDGFSNVAQAVGTAHAVS